MPTSGQCKCQEELLVRVLLPFPWGGLQLQVRLFRCQLGMRMEAMARALGRFVCTRA